MEREVAEAHTNGKPGIAIKVTTSRVERTVKALILGSQVVAKKANGELETIMVKESSRTQTAIITKASG